MRIDLLLQCRRARYRAETLAMAGTSPTFGGKTAVLHGIEDVRLEERPALATDGASLGPHDVLLAPHCVGICGSDMHYFLHAKIGGRDIPFPDCHATRFGGVLGHEASGRVIAVGSAVTRVAVGDRVAIEPGVPCGRCSACLGGRYNLCPDMRFLGSFLSNYSGALTQQMVHRENFLFKLPARVSFEEGAMLEPLSVGVQAVRRGKVGIGSRVLVTGAGPVGILAAMAAQAAGATTVAMTDINLARLQAAAMLAGSACGGGAGDGTGDGDGDSDGGVIRHGRVRAFHLPVGMASLEAEGEFDIALECSGAAPALELCLQRARRGGRVVLVGMGPLKVECRPVQIKELDLVGIFRYCNTYEPALQLVASGAIDLRPLVTHRFGLDDVGAAFAALKDDPAAVKVIIRPNQNDSDGSSSGGAANK